MKKLYISDLDGTLLNNDARLSERSFELLNSAIEDGCCFTVATARTFATVTDIFKGIDLKLPLVLMNGVMIYDPAIKNIISSEAIDYNVFNEVLSVFNKFRMSPLVYTDCGDHLLIKYNNNCNEYQMSYVDTRNSVTGKKFIYSPTLSCSKDEKIIYLVMLDRYDIINGLYQEIKTIDGISAAFYRDNYTDCYFLEIFAKGVSKATGLRKIKDLVDPDIVFAFGDNLNDIDLLKEANVGVCVANSCEELKKIADNVIGSNNDNAVAEYIYKNFRENKNG